MIDIIYAEFYKFKGMFKRYYLDSIAEIVSYLILFTGLFYTIFQQTTDYEAMLFQLLSGIFIWYVGINSIAVFSFILQEEMQLGTLEQIYLTRTSLTKMLLGRALATFVFDSIGGLGLTFLTFMAISLFSSTNSMFFEIFSSLNWFYFILYIVITMVGIYGFSFLLAGLSIVYKKISAITVILNYIFLYFTGITLANSTLPGVVDIFSKLLPITWGVINIQDIFSKDKLSDFILNYDFLFLILNSILYLIIGLIVFKLMLAKAKKDGNLGSY